MNNRIFITDALRWAFSLWKRALPAAWAPLLGIALLGFLTTPVLDVPPLGRVACVLLNIPVSVVAYGALLRLALVNQHPDDDAYKLGPAGLQWNVIETRLLGSFLLLALFFILACLGAVFVVMLTAIIVAAVSGTAFKPGDVFFTTPSGIAGGLVLVVAVCLIFWSAVRLTLTTPATADRKQIQVFSTWKDTQGQAMTLIVCFLAIALPGVALNWIATFLNQMGGGEHVPPLAATTFTLYCLFLGLVQTPFGVGVSAYVYRRLQDRAARAIPPD